MSPRLAVVFFAADALTAAFLAEGAFTGGFCAARFVAGVFFAVAPPPELTSDGFLPAFLAEGAFLWRFLCSALCGEISRRCPSARADLGRRFLASFLGGGVLFGAFCAARFVAGVFFAVAPPPERTSADGFLPAFLAEGAFIGAFCAARFVAGSLFRRCPSGRADLRRRLLVSFSGWRSLARCFLGNGCRSCGWLGGRRLTRSFLGGSFFRRSLLASSSLGRCFLYCRAVCGRQLRRRRYGHGRVVAGAYCWRGGSFFGRSLLASSSLGRCFLYCRAVCGRQLRRRRTGTAASSPAPTAGEVAAASMCSSPCADGVNPIFSAARETSPRTGRTTRWAADTTVDAATSAAR